MVQISDWHPGVLFRFRRPPDRNKSWDSLLGSHTVQSHGEKLAKSHKHDWFILIFLAILIHPFVGFHRFVGKDMMADVRYPLKSNTILVWAVPMISLVLPMAIFAAFYFYRRDVYDLHHALLGILYSMLLTRVITVAIKDAVGRPCPDFFWCCFPEGKEVHVPT